MTERLITAAQLKRLQTLWGIYVRGRGAQWQSGGADARELRLHWLSELLGRPIDSAKLLTQAEARRAIDELQKILPAEFVRRAPPRPRDAEFDHALGTAGRKGDRSKVIYTPDAQTIARLERELHALGWSNERYEAWLRSNSSPIAPLTAPSTLAHYRRVIYGLRGIARHRAKASPQRNAEEVPA